MTDYKITFARSARRELQSFQAEIVVRILRKIEALATEPRPKGSTKLRGRSELWRIRVGVYRIVYGIDDSTRTVDITLIRHRKDVYRR